MRQRLGAQPWKRMMAVVAAMAMVAVACGGGDDGDGTATGGDGDGDAGAPQRGGTLVYGLEAETSGGWCLAEAQLAISGIQIARAMYDTLTAPDANGEIQPFLAESVEPNDDYTEWTITIREGIVFHDGSELTAEVVKNNLDAYRGAYEARRPLLFSFVFSDVAAVDVVDPLTVRVTTKRPWVSFPWFLHASGRLGMMAQAQLDSENCSREMIGTGPFRFVDWRENDRLRVEAFDQYWRDGTDGQPLPYLNAIEFRPIPDSIQRVNALDAGQIQAMHTSDSSQIVTLQELADAGDVDLLQTEDYTEVSYTMLNASTLPFSDERARMAIAYASDREEYREVIDLGVNTIASGPFAPGSVGYLEDTGFPERNLERARELVAEYEAEHGPLQFSYTTTPTPATTQIAQLAKERWEEAGAEVSINQVEQAQLINTAIGGQFQAMGWRNHPGGDPDLQYVWWHSGSPPGEPPANPVNFGRINDPEIDRLLDEGRTTADTAEREQIYQDLNRRFAEQVWNVWMTWTVWAVGTAPDVNGLQQGELPDGGELFPGLATGHDVAGLWIGE